MANDERERRSSIPETEEQYPGFSTGKSSPKLSSQLSIVGWQGNLLMMTSHVL
jgi:hypothetical protein